MSALHHVRRGSGPPLMLLHGLGMDWRGWEPILSRLAQSREVIAVALPGHGRSPMLSRRPDCYALTDAVQELIGDARPAVAGVSTGGGVAPEPGRGGAGGSG